MHRPVSAGDALRRERALAICRGAMFSTQWHTTMRLFSTIRGYLFVARDELFAMN
jgi:hypothetical protein